MPCYRCGARQVDPDRGQSPWRRGVRGDRQVLICPGCQSSVDWMAELDRCPRCASAHLVRRLGEAECRDCGAVRPAPDPPAPHLPGAHLPGAHLPGALPGHLATLAAAPEAPAAGGPAVGGSAVGGAAAGGAAVGGSAVGGAAAGGAAVGGPGVGGPAGAGSDLAREVEEALARVLGRA
jgi:hypothetical protein